MKRTIKLVARNILNSYLKFNLFAIPILTLLTFATPFDSYSQVPHGEIETASGTTQTPPSAKDDNPPLSATITDEQFELYKNFFYKLPYEVYHVIGKEKMELPLEELATLNEEELAKVCDNIIPFFQVLKMTHQAIVFGFGQEAAQDLDKKLF